MKVIYATILCCVVELLPVNGDVVSSFVCDFDDKSVAIVYFQGWSRELSIHCDAVVGFAQPFRWCCLDL